MDYLKELKEANEIICSFHAIIEREGKDTNWKGMKFQVNEILKKQHKIIYPKSIPFGTCIHYEGCVAVKHNLTQSDCDNCKRV